MRTINFNKIMPFSENKVEEDYGVQINILNILFQQEDYLNITFKNQDKKLLLIKSKNKYTILLYESEISIDDKNVDGLDLKNKACMVYDIINKEGKAINYLNFIRNLHHCQISSDFLKYVIDLAVTISNYLGAKKLTLEDNVIFDCVSNGQLIKYNAILFRILSDKEDNDISIYQKFGFVPNIPIEPFEEDLKKIRDIQIKNISTIISDLDFFSQTFKTCKAIGQYSKFNIDSQSGVINNVKNIISNYNGDEYVRTIFKNCLKSNCIICAKLLSFLGDSIISKSPYGISYYLSINRIEKIFETMYIDLEKKNLRV